MSPNHSSIWLPVSSSSNLVTSLIPQDTLWGYVGIETWPVRRWGLFDSFPNHSFIWLPGSSTPGPVSQHIHSNKWWREYCNNKTKKTIWSPTYISPVYYRLLQLGRFSLQINYHNVQEADGFKQCSSSESQKDRTKILSFDNLLPTFLGSSISILFVLVEGGHETEIVEKEEKTRP